MTDNYEICYKCGSKMYRDTRPETLAYKGQSAVVQQPGWYCSGCDEVVLSGKDAKATEPVFLELKTRVDK